VEKDCSRHVPTFLLCGVLCCGREFVKLCTCQRKPSFSICLRSLEDRYVRPVLARYRHRYLIIPQFSLQLAQSSPPYILLRRIALPIHMLDLQCAEINIFQHTHVDRRHAHEEIRICGSNLVSNKSFPSWSLRTDTSQHAARTTCAAEVMCDFGLGTECVLLKHVELLI
jgi:hypothetical protein